MKLCFTVKINGLVRCLSKEGQKVVAHDTENTNIINNKQSKVPLRSIRYQCSEMTFNNAKDLYNSAVPPLKGILKGAGYPDSRQERKTVTWSFIKPVDSISFRTKQILSKVFQPKTSSVAEVKTDRIVTSS